MKFPMNYQSLMVFLQDDYQDEEIHGKFYTQYSSAQCFPTESILRALNVTHIDFFSLDIEMVEEPMLETFPFDDITVDVWAIEHRIANISLTSKADIYQNHTLHELIEKGFPENIIKRRKSILQWVEHTEFINFMISKGYYYFDMTCAIIGDYIFVRKESEIFKKLEVPKEQENRTQVCDNKLLLTMGKLFFTTEDIRDPHHYPDIKYKYLI